MATRDASDGSPDAPGDDPLGEIGVVLGAAVAGFGAYLLWLVVFTSLGSSVLGPLSEVQQSMLSPPALLLGMITGTSLYFRHTRHDVSFLDVRMPSLREVLYTIGGLLGLLGMNVGLDWLYRYFSVPTPEHGTVELIASADPIVLAYFVVASLLFVGPGEELMFRNVIQKRLHETFSPAPAIVLASFVFAIVHFTAYFSTDPVQLVASLATVLLLALLLGWIYHRTRNLVVVAIVHGGYDAVLFASLYADQVAMLGSS